MPKLDIKEYHKLTQTEALNRIKKFIPKLKAEHSDKISDVEEKWSGNSAEFKLKISGFKVRGSLEVENNYVLIKGDITLLAAPFKGKIESIIREKAKELLK